MCCNKGYANMVFLSFLLSICKYLIILYLPISDHNWLQINETVDWGDYCIGFLASVEIRIGGFSGVWANAWMNWDHLKESSHSSEMAVDWLALRDMFISVSTLSPFFMCVFFFFGAPSEAWTEPILGWPEWGVVTDWWACKSELTRASCRLIEHVYN